MPVTIVDEHVLQIITDPKYDSAPCDFKYLMRRLPFLSKATLRTSVTQLVNEGLVKLHDDGSFYAIDWRI